MATGALGQGVMGKSHQNRKPIYRCCQYKCNEETLKLYKFIQKRNTKTEQIKDEIKDNDNDKLPKLEIKIFCRNVKYWQSFTDSFQTVIDTSTNLNNVEKPNYLRSYLERDAPEGTGGLLLTDNNYSEVLGVLKKKHGNPDVIINSHMSALIKISPVVSNDVHSLRK